MCFVRSRARPLSGRREWPCDCYDCRGCHAYYRRCFPRSVILSTPRAWLWPRPFAGTPAANAVLDLMPREADARANLVWSATLQVEDIGQTVQRELEGLPILPAISVDIQRA